MVFLALQFRAIKKLDLKIRNSFENLEHKKCKTIENDKLDSFTSCKDRLIQPKALPWAINMTMNISPCKGRFI